MKLGNLFLNDKMEIKLGDFGLATKLEFEGGKKKITKTIFFILFTLKKVIFFLYGIVFTQ